VAAGEHERVAPTFFDRLGEIDHLGGVGKVVERKSDRLRPEALDFAPQVMVTEDLEVEDAHIVAGGAHRRRHALHAERFEPQVNLAVHQRTRMHEQDPHSFLRMDPDGVNIPVSIKRTNRTLIRSSGWTGRATILAPRAGSRTS
jgi:hypothetical protein